MEAVSSSVMLPDPDVHADALQDMLWELMRCLVLPKVGKVLCL